MLVYNIQIETCNINIMSHLNNDNSLYESL